MFDLSYWLDSVPTPQVRPPVVEPLESLSAFLLFSVLFFCGQGLSYITGLLIKHVCSQDIKGIGRKIYSMPIDSKKEIVFL